eukprot:g4397.t1
MASNPMNEQKLQRRKKTKGNADRKYATEKNQSRGIGRSLRLTKALFPVTTPSSPGEKTDRKSKKKAKKKQCPRKTSTRITTKHEIASSDDNTTKNREKSRNRTKCSVSSTGGATNLGVFGGEKELNQSRTRSLSVPPAKSSSTLFCKDCLQGANDVLELRKHRITCRIAKLVNLSRRLGYSSGWNTQNLVLTSRTRERGEKKEKTQIRATKKKNRIGRVKKTKATVTPSIAAGRAKTKAAITPSIVTERVKTKTTVTPSTVADKTLERNTLGLDDELSVFFSREEGISDDTCGNALPLFSLCPPTLAGYEEPIFFSTPVKNLEEFDRATEVSLNITPSSLKKKTFKRRGVPPRKRKSVQCRQRTSRPSVKRVRTKVTSRLGSFSTNIDDLFGNRSPQSGSLPFSDDAPETIDEYRSAIDGCGDDSNDADDDRCHEIPLPPQLATADAYREKLVWAPFHVPENRRTACKINRPYLRVLVFDSLRTVQKLLVESIRQECKDIPVVVRHAETLHDFLSLPCKHGYDVIVMDVRDKECYNLAKAMSSNGEGLLPPQCHVGSVTKRVVIVGVVSFLSAVHGSKALGDGWSFLDFTISLDHLLTEQIKAVMKDIARSQIVMFHEGRKCLKVVGGTGETCTLTKIDSSFVLAPVWEYRRNAALKSELGVALSPGQTKKTKKKRPSSRKIRSSTLLESTDDESVRSDTLFDLLTLYTGSNSSQCKRETESSLFGLLPGETFETNVDCFESRTRTLSRCSIFDSPHLEHLRTQMQSPRSSNMNSPREPITFDAIPALSIAPSLAFFCEPHDIAPHSTEPAVPLPKDFSWVPNSRHILGEHDGGDDDDRSAQSPRSVSIDDLKGLLDGSRPDGSGACGGDDNEPRG